MLLHGLLPQLVAAGDVSPSDWKFSLWSEVWLMAEVMISKLLPDLLLSSGSACLSANAAADFTTTITQKEFLHTAGLTSVCHLRQKLSFKQTNTFILLSASAAWTWPGTLTCTLKGKFNIFGNKLSGLWVSGPDSSLFNSKVGAEYDVISRSSRTSRKTSSSQVSYCEDYQLITTHYGLFSAHNHHSDTSTDRSWRAPCVRTTSWDRNKTYTGFILQLMMHSSSWNCWLGAQSSQFEWTCPSWLGPLISKYLCWQLFPVMTPHI